MNNILLDSLLATAILAGGILALRLLSARIGVSALPIYVCSPLLFVVGLLLYVPASPFFMMSDGDLYRQWGSSIASQWRGDGVALDRPIWPGKGFWPLIIAILSLLVTPISVSLVALNTITFGLATVLLQKSVLLISRQRARWITAFAVLTCVPIVLFAPSILRESIFWLGVSGGVLAVAYMVPQKVRLALANFAWSSLVLLAVRPDAGVVFVYGFAAVLAVLAARAIIGPPAWRFIAATGVLASLAVSAPFAFGLLREDAEVDTISNVADALSGSEVNSSFVGDGAQILQGNFCDASLILRVGCGALENLPRTMFGPFIWEIEPQPVWIAASLSTLHFLAVLALAGYYVSTRIGRNLTSFSLVAVAALSLVMFAAILTNYGIVMRFRMATEIVLLPLAIAGFFALKEKLVARRSSGTPAAGES